jgi:hypothetical protein
MGFRDLIGKVPTPLKQALKDKVYPDLIPEGELAPEWHLQDQDDN